VKEFRYKWVPANQNSPKSDAILEMYFFISYDLKGNMSSHRLFYRYQESIGIFHRSNDIELRCWTSGLTVRLNFLTSASTVRGWISVAWPFRQDTIRTGIASDKLTPIKNLEVNFFYNFIDYVN